MTFRESHPRALQIGGRGIWRLARSAFMCGIRRIWSLIPGSVEHAAVLITAHSSNACPLMASIVCCRDSAAHLTNTVDIGQAHFQSPSIVFVATTKVIVDRYGNLIGALMQRQVE